MDPFHAAGTTISFVHLTGDAIPEAKAFHSLDCFNVAESTCANKQPVTSDRMESLSPCVNQQ